MFLLLQNCETILYFSWSFCVTENVPIEYMISKQEIVSVLIAWASANKTTSSLSVDCMTNSPPQNLKVDYFFHYLILFR